MGSLENWVLAWGDEAWDRSREAPIERGIIVVSGHFHHHRVTFAPRRICLSVEGEVAVLVVDDQEERRHKIYLSDGEVIEIEREFLGL